MQGGCREEEGLLSEVPGADCTDEQMFDRLLSGDLDVVVHSSPTWSLARAWMNLFRS